MYTPPFIVTDDVGINVGVNLEVFIKQTSCRKSRHMGSTGQEYETKYYNLDAIISVGYRVIQDRLFESDFDRFALPTLPFEEE